MQFARVPIQRFLASCVLLLAAGTWGCNTITSLAIIPPILGINLLQSAALDAVATPVPFANAGADAVTLTGERIVLNGGGSGVVTGSGNLNTNPSPAPTFAWSVVSAPIGDANTDGSINDSDLGAAGVELDLATTQFPQFSSPVAGDYVVQLSMTWTNAFGIASTVTDTVNIRVFAPAP